MFERFAPGRVVAFVAALACDLRVMARDAWLSIPEVAIGMPLTWGALPLLLREIGPSRTIELVTTDARTGATDSSMTWSSARIASASSLMYAWIRPVIPPRNLTVYPSSSFFS